MLWLHVCACVHKWMLWLHVDIVLLLVGLKRLKQIFHKHVVLGRLVR